MKLKKDKILKGKNCLITGASSGLGRCIAHRIVERGANVILVGRNVAALKQTAQLCSSNAMENIIKICPADISIYSEAQRVFTYAVEHVKKIDILVANAGISMHASTRTLEPIVFEKMMAGNFYTTINIIQVFLNMLIDLKGMICAITSIQAVVGVPYHSAYSSAKHAVRGYLESLELEQPELCITEIIPGWIRGTNLRANALDGKGRIIKGRDKHEYHRTSITVEECADAVIRGITKKQRYIYMPELWRHIGLIKYFFRGYLNRFITKRQFKSSK